MTYRVLRVFLLTDHPLVETCRVRTNACRAGIRNLKSEIRNPPDMAMPEQTTQSEICNPKSKIGRCDRQDRAMTKPCIAQVTLTRGLCAVMRGYARLSAPMRGLNLSACRSRICTKLHQIAR